MGGLTQGSQTTTAKPWGPAGDLYKDIYKGIGNAMTQGPQVYQGSTVTPFSDQTMSAFKGLTNLADKNSGGAGMSDNLQRILNNGGFTAGQKDTLGDMRSLSNNSGLNALANGNGFTPGEQSTVDMLRQNTNQASSMLDQIMSGNGLNGTQDAALSNAQDLMNNAALKGIMSGNGLTSMQQNAFDQMGNSTTKANNALQALADAGGMNADMRAAMDRYTQTATTPFDINANPAYNAVRQNALDAQAQALNGQAAAAGRYAGAANQSILAREQGKTASNMDYNEYLNDQNQKNIANQAIMSGAQSAIGNQSNALNQIGNNNNNLFTASGTGIQQQMQGANTLSGLQNNVFNMGQQGTTNKMNAAQMQQSLAQNLLNAQQQGVNNKTAAIGQLSGLQGNLFNAQNAGLQNLSTAYQDALLPYQSQQQVGAQLEDKQTQLKQDELRKFDASNPLNYYASILGSLQGTPQSQTTTTSPSMMSNLLSLTGLGLGGMGLYNQLFPASTGGGLVPGGGF